MASAPPSVEAFAISQTPLLPISGVDGYIAMCLGATTSILHSDPQAAFTNLLKAPGGQRAVPANQLYAVTDRAKKIADSRVPVTVYVDGTSVPPTQYRYFPGGNYIMFFQPLATPPTTGVTADFSYITTTTATDVLGLLHVNNWQLNLASNPIPGDEYGTLMAPQYRGKMSGTWQFDRYSAASAVDLYYLMMTRSFFVFSLYESLIENRQWIVYGDIGSNPMSAPTNGMVGGTITGTMVAMPSMIVEPLAA